MTDTIQSCHRVFFILLFSLRDLWIQLVIASVAFLIPLPFLLTNTDPGITLAMARFLAAVASIQGWK